MMNDQMKALIEQLGAIREKYGEQAYQDAARDVARSLIARGGEAEKHAREMFADIPGLDAPENTSVDSGSIIDLIKQTMPNLRTQAQFDAFMASFEALRASMDAIFKGMPGAVEAGIEAITKGFEAARKATEISNKLRDVPEAATSKTAEIFKEPPKEFDEVRIQRELLTELDGLLSLADLSRWYTEARERMDRVVSRSLRDALFDTIRAKKESLGEAG